MYSLRRGELLWQRPEESGRRWAQRQERKLCRDEEGGDSDGEKGTEDDKENHKKAVGEPENPAAVEKVLAKSLEINVMGGDTLG